jgi:uncharacterized protein involved in exopolysaccharide biosynthesis
MSEDLARSSSPVHALVPAGPARASEGYRALWITLFKWKWLILGLGVALALAAAITTMLQPPVWSATAKILLKTDRVPLQVSGVGLAAKAGRGASLEELTTEIEFLESAAVLLPVARALRMAGGEPADVPDSELQGMVDQLRARIIVTPVPRRSACSA